MRASARRLAGTACALALGAACTEEPQRAPPAAFVAPRASYVLEPTPIGIGDTAILEIAIVTPPGYRIAAFEAPQRVPGFRVLDAETVPLERQSTRWLQRTRVRLRARDVGRFVWPGNRVAFEAPDGSHGMLALDPLPLEVVSIMPEYPNRTHPFGARAEPARGESAKALAAAAAGSLLTLAALAAIGLARRRFAARKGERSPRAVPAESPWQGALRELAVARDTLPLDARGACDAAAATLRRYMARRFGAATVARTTEELDAATPPFAATSRWPGFVSLLRELDALRFPPEARGRDRGSQVERVGELLREAAQFIEATLPPESRR